MLQRSRYFSIVVLLSSLLFTSRAAQGCQGQPISVFFINGILTSNRGAHDSATAVRIAIENDIDSGRLNIDKTCLAVDEAYNYSVDAANDLRESVQGLADESIFWGIVNGVIEAAESIMNPLLSRIHSHFLDALERRTVDEHKDLYRTALSTGARIVLVAHSQGNLFANQEYRELLPVEQNRIRIVAVATPSSTVEAGGNHTTLFNDVIALVFGALEPNSTNRDLLNCAGLRTGFRCHDFLNSYMPGVESGIKIVQQLRTAISASQAATPQCPPSFTDNFNRPDGLVANGWTNTTGNTNGDLVIRAGALAGPPGRAAIYRPVDLYKTITVSATLNQENGFGGSGRYGGFLFGNNGSVLSGYGVFFGRYPQNTGNLTVQLILNGTQGLANAIAPAASFQFGPSIIPTVTFSPDGSITGTVAGNGTTFSFNLDKVNRGTLPGANVAIYSQGESDGASNPAIDNVSITYGCPTPGQ